MVTFNGHGQGQENLEFSPTYREESFQGLDSENSINTIINKIELIIEKIKIFNQHISSDS